jgi:K+-sensing histidine kinase KdpD
MPAVDPERHPRLLQDRGRRPQLDNHPFELRECVESALELVAVPAADKGIELVADLDDSCPWVVVGDATRLRQVLVNLLSNAVKFTATGEVVVSLSAISPAPADGVRQPANPRLVAAAVPEKPVVLSVSVRDTGIGIPADRLDRLFESFSQLDASSTRTYGGSGLGLAISRRLVEAMGGSLDVDSNLGAGSTFTFTVALTERTEQRLSPVAVGGSLAGPVGAGRRRQRHQPPDARAAPARLGDELHVSGVVRRGARARRRRRRVRHRGARPAHARDGRR